MIKKYLQKQAIKTFLKIFIPKFIMGYFDKDEVTVELTLENVISFYNNPKVIIKKPYVPKKEEKLTDGSIKVYAGDSGISNFLQELGNYLKDERVKSLVNDHEKRVLDDLYAQNSHKPFEEFLAPLIESVLAGGFIKNAANESLLSYLSQKIPEEIEKNEIFEQTFERYEGVANGTNLAGKILRVKRVRRTDVNGSPFAYHVEIIPETD
ncbi:MAG: hypothetical protein PHG04_01190 [Candidatus Nanoarchaeia archaeon]|nr:hypothetical protein [Candidatus Nanoarchaeia archaeon]MDD5053977.1 hypothetical protein [Candidatus Nanoarchaeia archaeon]